MTTFTRVRRSAAIALAYVLTAELALSISVARDFATIIWPPTGIALGAILLYGPRLWPGVAAGTLITVLVNGHSPMAALFIAAADTVEALLGYVLLSRVLGFHRALDRMRDVMALAVVSVGIAFLSTGISATGLMIAGAAIDDPERLFGMWWWGHVTANLVVAPVLLTWVTRSPTPELGRRPRPVEAVMLMIGVCVVEAILFTRWFPEWLPGARAPYYLLPLLLWAGLRFGPRGAATATCAVGTMAIAGTSRGLGPFDNVADLQSFVTISSITTLVLSAMALERLRAVQRRSAIQLAALDAIVSVDEHGRVFEFNPAAERLFGLPARDILGKDAGDLLIPAIHRETYRRALRGYIRTGTTRLAGHRYRVLAQRKDGSEFYAEISVASVPMNGHNLLTGFIRDVTTERAAKQLLEHKVAERTRELTRINHELERGEELLRQAEELAHLGSFELDLRTKQVEWSAELYRIFGADPATFVPTFDAFIAAVHPDDRAAVEQAIDTSIATGQPFAIEERIVLPDGSIRVLQSTGRVFNNGSPHAVRITGCCQDITERKQAEEARYRLVDIAESSEDAIIGLSVTGEIETWNAAAAKIFAYAAGEVIGQPVTMLVEEIRAEQLRRLVAAVAGGARLPHYEMPYRRKYGAVFDASVSTSAIRDHESRVIGLSKIVRDISEQKSAEKRLKLSLHEKEVLLREIHHRVKNNLQVISSLLNLQVSGETSEQARKGLLESQSRIQSMALVHQLLYQSKDLARIDFSEYLRNLAARLLETYKIGPSHIDLTVDAQPVHLDIDRAIPCGLIVNELVANAIDHAFPDARQGHIWVSLEALDRDRVALAVRDNGIGVPPEIELESTHTFGLQIARTLTAQLDGAIELTRDGGTTIRVVLPKHAIA